jgi:hypothetical protein
MALHVQADSIDPKGIVLPRKYNVYWLMVRSDGFAPKLRKATCKVLMTLIYILTKAKTNLRQTKRTKKYVVFADCVNPAGVVLPRNYETYWMVLNAVRPAWLYPVLVLQKYVLTVAEFIAQV